MVLGTAKIKAQEMNCGVSALCFVDDDKHFVTLDSSVENRKILSKLSSESSEGHSNPGDSSSRAWDRWKNDPAFFIIGLRYCLTRSSMCHVLHLNELPSPFLLLPLMIIFVNFNP